MSFLLMLGVSGCADTPNVTPVDTFCLVVDKPPVTSQWSQQASQVWIDWIVPILDYGERHCQWKG